MTVPSEDSTMPQIAFLRPMVSHPARAYLFDLDSPLMLSTIPKMQAIGTPNRERTANANPFLAGAFLPEERSGSMFPGR